ncbi:Male sterility NAD-binding [Penicillium freii]|nr:Male sterility NAD-binding [Penicillium freii]
MLVLSNGEKVRPVAMEAIINSHPAVSSCLVVGTGYTMTSLLVELVFPELLSTTEQEAILDSIMEKVHTANAIGSKLARFAKPGKPFARTDKNIVKRRETIVLYEKEIEQFHKSME